ncbi:MAG: hypothetical protein GX434_02665 [Peptococcaceae bacterium]|nr:hypothetical protein [Peptococcaceae bacterium]
MAKAIMPNCYGQTKGTEKYKQYFKNQATEQEAEIPAKNQLQAVTKGN